MLRVDDVDDWAAMFAICIERVVTLRFAFHDIRGA